MPGNQNCLNHPKVEIKAIAVRATDKKLLVRTDRKGRATNRATRYKTEQGGLNLLVPEGNLTVAATKQLKL